MLNLVMLDSNKLDVSELCELPDFIAIGCKTAAAGVL
jgi:hypothetical protein